MAEGGRERSGTGLGAEAGRGWHAMGAGAAGAAVVWELGREVPPTLRGGHLAQRRKYGLASGPLSPGLPPLWRGSLQSEAGCNRPLPSLWGPSFPTPPFPPRQQQPHSHGRGRSRPGLGVQVAGKIGSGLGARGVSIPNLSSAEPTRRRRDAERAPRPVTLLPPGALGTNRPLAAAGPSLKTNLRRPPRREAGEGHVCNKKAAIGVRGPTRLQLKQA